MKPPKCRFIPPHCLESMGQCDDDQARSAVRNSISQEHHLERGPYKGLMAGLQKAQNTGEDKNRRIHDMQHSADYYQLPGHFVMDDSIGSTKDPDLQAVFDNLGIVYDFYKQVLGVNSLDNRGMDLIGCGHFGSNYSNAYWDGSHMVFGDGDQYAFKTLHRALDVCAHEMTHGRIDRTARLIYKGESGALNESIADVFGVTVEQWHRQQLPHETDWLVGDEVMGPGTKAIALRTFTAEKAYKDDRLFGTDPQPKHMRDFIRTTKDNGGVHLNSGIPNHAYYLFATRWNGPSWGLPIQIWHDALLSCWFWDGFSTFARHTVKKAARLDGPKSSNLLRECWNDVGIRV